MTGPFLPQPPSPGHRTSGCDPEHHLDPVKGEDENEHGCTSSLLPGRDGGEGEEHVSIYAGKAVQEKGKMAGEEYSPTSKSHFDTRIARYRAKLPPAVSLLNVSCVTPASCLATRRLLRVSTVY